MYVHQCRLACVSLVHTCIYSSVEETCIELTRAIEAGDTRSASAIAATLARQQTALKIQPFARDYDDTEIK